MNFASENHAGAHPRIMDALMRANTGFVPSYGSDEYTVAITEKFKKLFNRDDIAVFFCFNGTGANNFALSSITEKYHSIFCSDVSHIYNAESTAPEAFIGCRLFPIISHNGKIDVNDLTIKLKKRDGVYLPIPAALTITQPTECGTTYTLKELKDIKAVCKENNTLLHIDGARIYNALAHLNCSFEDIDADVITIGGTKSGLLFGEAVIFFDRQRFKNLQYNHKRSMQLASKNRFIAAQFIELFENDLWLDIAKYTNELAQYFKQQVKDAVYPVESNAVFLQKDKRYMFSFNNTKEEIDQFVNKLK